MPRTDGLRALCRGHAELPQGLRALPAQVGQAVANRCSGLTKRLLREVHGPPAPGEGQLFSAQGSNEPVRENGLLPLKLSDSRVQWPRRYRLADPDPFFGASLHQRGVCVGGDLRYQRSLKRRRPLESRHCSTAFRSRVGNTTERSALMGEYRCHRRRTCAGSASRPTSAKSVPPYRVPPRGVRLGVAFSRCFACSPDDGYRVVCVHTTPLRNSEPPRGVAEVGAKLRRAHSCSDNGGIDEETRS